MNLLSIEVEVVKVDVRWKMVGTNFAAAEGSSVTRWAR